MSQKLKTKDLFDRSRVAFRNLRLNLVETVFLATAVLFAALVIGFYLTKITPLQLELNDLRAREAKARAELSQYAKQQKELAELRDNAQKIVESLSGFEGKLKYKSEGVTQVITEFAQLAKANRISGSGVSFRTIEPDQIDDNNPTKSVRANKEVSVYPALGLDTTVEGDYHNLRRYISDLERSKQFIIINSITLQSVDEKTRSLLKGGMPTAMPAGPMGPGQRPGQLPGQPQRPQTAPATASPEAVNVSLKIETDTYFRKPGTQ